MREPVLSLLDALKCCVAGIILSIVFTYASNALDEANAKTLYEEADPVKLQQLKEYAYADCWPPGYTVQDKVEILDEAKKDTLTELGGSVDVELKTGNLPMSTAAQFVPNEKIIVFNEQVLEQATPLYALNTLFHEVFHSYEYEVAMIYAGLKAEDQRLIFFDEAEDYYYEFTHYVKGSVDETAYRSQKIEVDSRRYSESMLQMYLDEYCATSLERRKHVEIIEKDS